MLLGLKFWLVVGGYGWFRVVVGGFGSLWVVLGRCGWFWVVPHFSKYDSLFCMCKDYKMKMKKHVLGE